MSARRVKRSRGLGDYLQAKRRERCIVCSKIPERVRKEMRDVLRRQPRGMTAAIALEWLRADHGIRITLDQWRGHTHAGHQP